MEECDFDGTHMGPDVGLPPCGRKGWVTPCCGVGMNPPFSFPLAEKKTLQRGLSCPCGAIHLPGRSRSKRKDAKRPNFPVRGNWTEVRECSESLRRKPPGLIRLRCGLAPGRTFMPHVDTWVQTLMEVPDALCFSFRCRSVGACRGAGIAC